jgi:predicted phosphoribosyltransferase
MEWAGITYEPLVELLGLSDEDVSRCVAEGKETIERKVERFRGNRPFPDLNKITLSLSMMV